MGERATITSAMRCSTSSDSPSQADISDVHIGQGCARFGPYM